MPAAAKQKKIEELLSKATESNARGMWFEAERIALKALAMARQEEDFAAMASAVKPLWEARSQRFRKALAIGPVTIFAEAPITDELRLSPGAYLVQPPNVGADARRLRLSALNNDINAVVLCREPQTKSKMVPVVAISPGITVRAKVDPPEDLQSPDLDWYIDALQALGESALAGLPDDLAPVRRIDAIVERLDALPEDELLHSALLEACQEAHKAQQAQPPARAKSTGSGGRAKG